MTARGAAVRLQAQNHMKARERIEIWHFNHFIKSINSVWGSKAECPFPILIDPK